MIQVHTRANEIVVAAASVKGSSDSARLFTMIDTDAHTAADRHDTGAAQSWPLSKNGKVVFCEQAGSSQHWEYLLPGKLIRQASSVLNATRKVKAFMSLALSAALQRTSQS